MSIIDYSSKVLSLETIGQLTPAMNSFISDSIMVNQDESLSSSCVVDYRKILNPIFDLHNGTKSKTFTIPSNKFNTTEVEGFSYYAGLLFNPPIVVRKKDLSISNCMTDMLMASFGNAVNENLVMAFAFLQGTMKLLSFYKQHEMIPISVTQKQNKRIKPYDL